MGSNSTRKHRRLLAPRPTDPYLDAETALRRLRARHRQELDAITDPEPGPIGTVEARPWSAEEIGRLVLGIAAGHRLQDIAEKLPTRTLRAIVTKLTWVRRGLERMTPAQAGALGGHSKARKRRA